MTILSQLVLFSCLYFNLCCWFCCFIIYWINFLSCLFYWFVISGFFLSSFTVAHFDFSAFNDFTAVATVDNLGFWLNYPLAYYVFPPMFVCYCVSALSVISPFLISSLFIFLLLKNISPQSPLSLLLLMFLFSWC